jgi:glutamyl/glutaminyl-tRNA synthetase
MASKKLPKKTNVVNFEDLPRLINKCYDACQACFMDALSHAFKVGKYLIQAKAGTPPKQWTGWLDVHCPNISARMAQHYMNLSTHRKLIEASGVDTLRDAIKLLAKPKNETISVLHPTDGKKNKQQPDNEDDSDRLQKNKQQQIGRKNDTVSHSVDTAISSDDEETTAPQGKVVKLESQNNKLERKKYSAPDEENTINKDNEKDKIIAKLQKENRELKSKLSRLTSNEQINISKRELRAGAKQLAEFIKDDIELANEICQIIMVEVTAVLEAYQNYVDDEF